MKEVARFLLPLAVTGMDKMVDWLERCYGDGLVLTQVGEWMVVEAPE